MNQYCNGNCRYCNDLIYLSIYHIIVLSSTILAKYYSSPRRMTTSTTSTVHKQTYTHAAALEKLRRPQTVLPSIHGVHQLPLEQ
jgi:hypothetical protein